MSSVPVTGYLLQVLDPAEATLPYDGRVRFEGLQGERDALISRGEVDSRHLPGPPETAAGRARGDLLRRWIWLRCARTDHAPETALLSLYNALGVR